MCEAGLGVTHGSRGIALDRAEVTLTIDKRFAHRPWLGHVHESGINGSITVRVILTHRLTNNTGTLQVSLRCRQGKVMVHRVEEATLGGLQAIAGIGQGPGNDDGHRVVQKGLRHFVSDVDRFDIVAWLVGFCSVVRHRKLVGSIKRRGFAR